MKTVTVYLNDEDAQYLDQQGYKYATIIRKIVNQWVTQRKAHQTTKAPKP